MTTIGAGAFGPPLTTEHTEKEWPVGEKWRFTNPKYVSFLLTTDRLEEYLPSKFYGAEWIERESMKYPWMECKRCHGYLRTEEQMILHSEQNPGHDNFENIPGGVMGMTYKPIFIGGYPKYPDES